MASELVHAADGAPPPPLLDALLREPGTADEQLGTVPPVHALGEEAGEAAAAIDHLLHWGGMPALLPLPDGERQKWLQSYDSTYLERDLGDLAPLNDLMPFRRFQRLCALRSGQLLSFSDLARDAGLSVSTSRRYIEYLRISYQAFLLSPWATNLTSAVVKTPKVFWGDLGLWAHLTATRVTLPGRCSRPWWSPRFTSGSRRPTCRWTFPSIAPAGTGGRPPDHDRAWYLGDRSEGWSPPGFDGLARPPRGGRGSRENAGAVGLIVHRGHAIQSSTELGRGGRRR